MEVQCRLSESCLELNFIGRSMDAQQDNVPKTNFVAVGSLSSKLMRKTQCSISAYPLAGHPSESLYIWKGYVNSLNVHEIPLLDFHFCTSIGRLSHIQYTYGNETPIQYTNGNETPIQFTNGNETHNSARFCWPAIVSQFKAHYESVKLSLPIWGRYIIIFIYVNNIYLTPRWP